MPRLGRHFFTADQLFGDETAAQARGFTSVDDARNAMIEAWNAVVSEDDLVWVLGGFTATTYRLDASLLHSLNGGVRLIAGPLDPVFAPNVPDEKWLKDRVGYYLEQGFKSVVTGTAIARHHGRPYVLPLRGRSDLRCQSVIVSALPYDLTELEEPPDRFAPWRPKRPRVRAETLWLLHGNQAGWMVQGHQVNVGADHWGFEPVDGETIVALIEDAEKAHAG